MSNTDNYDNEHPDSLVQISKESVEPEQRESESPSVTSGASAKAPKNKKKSKGNVLAIGLSAVVILVAASGGVAFYLTSEEESRVANTQPSLTDKANPKVVQSAANDVVSQIKQLQVAKNKSGTQKTSARGDKSDAKMMNEIKSQLQAQGNKIGQIASEVSKLRDSGASSNQQSLSDGTLDKVASKINQILADQELIKQRLNEVEGVSKTAMSEIDKKVSALSLSVKELEAQEKQQTAAAQAAADAVKGNELKLVSVSPGFAFIRDLRQPDEDPFSLTVGEMLRGHGRVEKITGTGCIHTTKSKLQPVGGICSEG